MQSRKCGNQYSIQHPLGHAGGELLAVLLHVVHGVVLECRNQLEVFRIAALQPFDERDAQAPREIRIFPISLLIAPPVRVASDVDDGSPIDESLVFAGSVRVQVPAIVNRAGFVGNRSGNFMNQVRIPGGRHGDGYREHGRGAVPADAVQALVPAIAFDAETLHRSPLMVQHHRFLFQGEAPYQVLGAFFSRLGWIKEERLFACRQPIRRQGQQRQGQTQRNGTVHGRWVFFKSCLSGRRCLMVGITPP